MRIPKLKKGFEFLNRKRNKLMKIWIAFIAVLFSFIQPTLADFSMGKVVMQLDTLPPQTLNIVSAILYRQVDVVQDTVAFIQDSEGVHYLFGPQFVEGKKYVLQLHMVDTDSGHQFYDVGFVLGDTLKQYIEISHEKNGVYFNPSGQLTPYPQTASNLNAVFNFNEINEHVTGTFQAQFLFTPVEDSLKRPVPVSMQGELKAPVGTYKETSIATESENLEQKRRYQRNLAIAIIITFITIVALGI